MNTPDLDPRTHDLQDRLARRAGSIDLGPAVVDVVMARGHQRQQRRRAVVGVTTVAGIAGASVVAIAALSRPSDNGSIVAAPTGSDQTASTSVDTTAADVPTATVAAPDDTTPVDPAALVPSPFVWNRVDPDSSEAVSLMWGGVDNGIAGSGPFVAWSTEPGRTDEYRPTLWRSDDGQRWQQVSTDPDFVARNVAERNGTFITFGTTPATASERRSDLSVGTSVDGGRSWSTAVLPLDTSDLADEPGVDSVGVMASSMATSPAGVLLSASVNANVDIVGALPAEYQGAPWQLIDDGVEILAGDACATATTVVIGGAASTVPAGADTTAPTPCETVRLTWSELGLSERAAEAVVRPEVLLFFSADGLTFDRIEAPAGFAADWTSARLTSFGDGFAALVNDRNGASRLLSSADGRAWTDLGTLPVDWPESIDEFEGRLVVTGWTGNTYSRQYIAVRDVSGAWTTTDLRTFLQPGDGVLPTLGASHLAVGPSGITVVGWLTRDPIAEAGGIALPLDGGITVDVANTSMDHVVRGPDGSVLAEITRELSSDPALVTPLSDDMWGYRYDVRLEADGPVVASYTYEDLNEAVVAAGAYDLANTTVLVLHSSDGVSWSREALADLAGEAVTGSGGIRLAGNQVIVAANLADDRNPDGTAKQTLLIGTPAG